MNKTGPNRILLALRNDNAVRRSIRYRSGYERLSHGARCANGWTAPGALCDKKDDRVRSREVFVAGNAQLLHAVVIGYFEASIAIYRYRSLVL